MSSSGTRLSSTTSSPWKRSVASSEPSVTLSRQVDSITLELSVWSGNPHNCALYSPHPMPGPQISVASEQVQLASTRIPLRSALFRLSQWWPLIPTDPASSQAPPISSADPTIPPMFFNKMPSMDFIGRWLHPVVSILTPLQT